MGGGLSFPTFHGPFHGGKFNLKFDPPSILPRVAMDFGLQLKRKIGFLVYSDFQALSNVSMNVGRSYEDFYSGEKYAQRTLHKVRTNAFQYGIQLRFSTDMTPKSFYVQFNLGLSSTFSRIYTSETITQDNALNSIIDDSQVTYRLEPWNSTATIPHIGLAIGKQVIVARSIFLDFGVKSNFYFGNYSGASLDNIYSTEDFTSNLFYREKFHGAIKTVSIKALQGANLSQIYGKIGFIL